jgi:sugar lactone lactonase YvrE
MAKDFNGGRKLLYVVGSSKIFKIDLAPATPVATLIAGTGALGFTDSLPPATNGLLRAPQGITVDTSGNVYIADRDNFAVRMIPASGPLAGALITIAGKTGTQTEGYASSATTLDGTATLPTSTTACLSSVYYVAAQGNGTAGTKLYVADATTSMDNQAIRVITVTSPSAGALTYTLDDPSKPAGYAYAGSPKVTGNADGLGAFAKFNIGAGSGANLATLPDGSQTFLADTGNNAVRVITANGAVTTLKDATSTNFVFTAPKSVALKVNPATKALTALFVGDAAATKKIRRFTPNGDGTFTEDTTFAITGGTFPVSPDAQGMAVDSTGTGMLYVADATLAKVFKVDLSSNTSSDLVAATGAKPMGVALQNDASGTFLWVAVSTANQVKKYDLSGTLLLTVGTGVAGYADGTAATATLVAPTGIAVDANGFAFVNNYTNSQTSSQNGIRAINATTGDVTTLFGYATSTTAPTFYGMKPGLLLPDLAGTTAAKSLAGGVIYAPQGLTVNQNGDLLVSTPQSVYQVIAPANK